MNDALQKSPSLGEFAGFWSKSRRGTTMLKFYGIWLNLILSTPVIPKEKIFLIEGIHDLFAERQPIEELWQKWQQPEIWRLPHGHISGIFVPGLTDRVIHWLASRLEAGRKNNA
jgi:hypothetical protein